MKKEYAISFKNSVQIGPEDWETLTPTLKATEETTIGQIKEWYLSKFPGTPEQKEAIKLIGIQLNELETLQ